MGRKRKGEGTVPQSDTGVKVDAQEKTAVEIAADEYAAHCREQFLKLMSMESPREARESLEGKGGVLPTMAANLINCILKAESDVHIKNTKDEKNRHNGLMKKTMKSPIGNVEVSTPRDRNGSFSPEFIKKREVFLTKQMSDKIIAMYARGMSQGDISNMFEETYGVAISKASISEITDSVVSMMEDWQRRPLDPFYPIVYMDAEHFKVKCRNAGGDTTRAVYNVIGVDNDGHKDLIGMYVDHSEGAGFWGSVMDDLRERGMKDIGVACVDGLTGFPSAIREAFPLAIVQLCIVHQMRNSAKHVASKYRKEVMEDLKEVYHSTTREMAREKLEEARKKWGSKYPSVFDSWDNHWNELTAFYDFPPEVKHLIYTTNPIEGYHRQVRKVTKTKSIYPNDNALKKQIYLKYLLIEKKWKKETVADWDRAKEHLQLLFGERMKTY